MSSSRSCAIRPCGSTTAGSGRAAASRRSSPPTRGLGPARRSPSTWTGSTVRAEPGAGHADSRRIVAVVVTHRRRELLAASLDVVCGQTRPIDHLVVVDNADEQAVRELVESQPVEATYIGSRHNLGGAGGF